MEGTASASRFFSASMAALCSASSIYNVVVAVGAVDAQKLAMERLILGALVPRPSGIARILMRASEVLFKKVRAHIIEGTAMALGARPKDGNAFRDDSHGICNAVVHNEVVKCLNVGNVGLDEATTHNCHITGNVQGHGFWLELGTVVHSLGDELLGHRAVASGEICRCENVDGADVSRADHDVHSGHCHVVEGLLTHLGAGRDCQILLGMLDVDAFLVVGFCRRCNERTDGDARVSSARGSPSVC
eukprot:scaffold28338_cov38-Cyclotella_meneghiniana.AAC.6